LLAPTESARLNHASGVAGSRFIPVYWKKVHGAGVVKMLERSGDHALE